LECTAMCHLLLNHTISIPWQIMSDSSEKGQKSFIRLLKFSSFEPAFYCFSIVNRDGHWPDPTQAYFWPAVNKRQTRLWPGYFLTSTQRDFYWPKGKNWKIWHFRGNFPNPNPKQKWLTWPGSKFFDLDPSLVVVKQD